MGRSHAPRRRRPGEGEAKASAVELLGVPGGSGAEGALVISSPNCWLPSPPGSLLFKDGARSGSRSTPASPFFRWLSRAPGQLLASTGGIGCSDCGGGGARLWRPRGSTPPTFRRAAVQGVVVAGQSPPPARSRNEMTMGPAGGRRPGVRLEPRLRPEPMQGFKAGPVRRPPDENSPYGACSCATQRLPAHGGDRPWSTASTDSHHSNTRWLAMLAVRSYHWTLRRSSPRYHQFVRSRAPRRTVRWLQRQAGVRHDS